MTPLLPPPMSDETSGPCQARMTGCECVRPIGHDGPHRCTDACGFSWGDYWQVQETPAPHGAVLTAAELQCLDLLGEAANLLRSKIIGEGPAAAADWNEAAAHVHVLQAMVMRQAAARAYPDRFRLLGQTL